MAVSRRRRLLVTLSIIVVVAVVLLVLLYVPLEPSSISKTATTSMACGSSIPCPTTVASFSVGDSRYSTLSGTWTTSAPSGAIVVTINNGGSQGVCSLCKGMLYSSAGGGTGSFAVSGSGPFYFSVIPLMNGNQTTTFQITLDQAVL